MSALRPFPSVRRSDHEAGRSYQAMWTRWRGIEVEPLRITASLATAVMPGIDVMHLDGILSMAVDQQGPGIRVNAPERYALPLPIALAWTSPDGDPLWLTTDFRPVGEWVTGEVYTHSRYPTDVAHLAKRTSVLTAAGQFKDVRIPRRVVVAPCVEAYCFGHAETIRSLLADVTHIGKKGSTGCGRVLRWTVAPYPGIDEAWILERRPVPLAALAADVAVSAARIAPRMGWTPPYWDVVRHTVCRRAAWMD